MGNIWRYGCTGGEYAGKASDDMFASVPYIDQPPLGEIRADGEPLMIADQMFGPKLNQWIALVNALDRDDLDNLKAMCKALGYENDNLKQPNAKLALNDVATKQENTALKEKADSLAQTNSKTMFVSLQNSKDIAEIKKQLNPEPEGSE